ncbi:hypothetical protein VIGAN_02088600, partial [Vigna angularis var. angularis]
NMFCTLIFRILFSIRIYIIHPKPLHSFIYHHATRRGNSNAQRGRSCSCTSGTREWHFLFSAPSGCCSRRMKQNPLTSLKNFPFLLKSILI